MSNLTEAVDKNKIPKHVAVIMDGNGRWAKERGQNRLDGHAMGVDSVRATLKAARELGISYLTLYAFSTENWSRPKDEVDGLMDLLVQSITNEIDELNENGVRLLAIGDIDGLPEKCSHSLKQAIIETAKNDEISLILALNYSSKWEITKAIKSIASDIKSNLIDVDQISGELISSYLATKGIPDPELLIRTSGEHRLSNFLLWQIAYAEFYFTDVHWPDFGREQFIQALIDFQRRERRFGKVSEQIIAD
ncbi:MAG: isoprenyl transferase [Bacteroidetes bacterium]|nr:isoprenyl transferase [Bacteroidota bacterium]